MSDIISIYYWLYSMFFYGAWSWIIHDGDAADQGSASLNNCV